MIINPKERMIIIGNRRPVPFKLVSSRKAETPPCVACGQRSNHSATLSISTGNLDVSLCTTCLCIITNGGTP